MRLSGAIGWNPLYSKASGPARASGASRHAQAGGLTPLPLLFVSNHVTIVDDGFVDSLIFPPCLFFKCDFIPHHVPEERNFFKGRLMSWFMRRMKCIPVKRGEGLFQPAMGRRSLTG